KQRAAGNPWPEWPLVFRTSSSQEEGGTRAFGRSTTQLVGRDGRLEAMELRGVELGVGPDGRPRRVERPGSEEFRAVGLLRLAEGFLGPETEALREQLGLEFDSRGNIRVDRRFRTSHERVWAVGDARRGASLIVWAISDGREAARDVDSALTGGSARLPT